MKPEQEVLFRVARSDSAFTRETLRRGGPYEVMGRRWRSQRALWEVHEATRRPELSAEVLASINWPRRAK